MPSPRSQPERGSAQPAFITALAPRADTSFVIDAAGQIAERLMTWTMLDTDGELRRWLPTWRADGGDARRFRRGIGTRFPGDEAGAWRYSEAVLLPLRPAVRYLARALLVHPKHIPYAVVAALVEPSLSG